MNIAKFLLSSLSVVTLSACTNLDTLNRQTSRASGPFEAALTEEYRDFANAEQSQFDWYDSDYFARKGLAANNGVSPLPEDIRNWNVPESRYEELINAYNRLMRFVTDERMKQSFPQNLSKAQRYFDCWLEQEEERWQPSDIEDCRTAFLKEIAIVENRVTIPPQGHSHHKKPGEAIHKKHTVHFKFDKHSIDDAEKDKIDAAISDVKKLKRYRIDVGGHTDTAGPKSYNKKLSEKRANAVKDALTNGDVDSQAIQSQGFGEDILAVPTDDNVPNRQNRRVEINVHGEK